MKKIIALLLALVMVFALVACAAKTDAPAEETKTEEPAATETTTTEETTEPAAEETAEPAAEEGKVYNVAYLVNGNLGDKSFFDSAEAGLEELEAAGRIELTTIEMGGTDEDQPTWLSTLYDVSEDGGYDLIVCGTYQMPDYLKEVATQYPDQLYAIFDDTTYVGENQNVVNMSYRQNDMGYLIGVYAACMTVDTNIPNINEDAVVGFVGGVDSPVINDFLIGFIEGAQSVNPDIKVDTRYTNDYVDTAIAKEYGLSMINDNKCDIIWGVAGNAGNGAAEAALETGKAWFIGVDSDQELTFSPDLAAITLTSGLKNIGNSLVWLFDEWDAGRTYWGQVVELGIAEGGVGIVTDKNYDKLASAETKAAVEAAQNAILNGEVVVDSALTNQELATQLRDAVRPYAKPPSVFFILPAVHLKLLNAPQNAWKHNRALAQVHRNRRNASYARRENRPFGRGTGRPDERDHEGVSQRRRCQPGRGFYLAKGRNSRADGRKRRR